MDILITVRRRTPKVESRTIRRELTKALKGLGYTEGELSILLTGDEEIAELNSRYRGKEGPTNVLAFPMSDSPSTELDGGMLGDIVVSLDTARRESEALGEPFSEVLFRLLIHGLLHLVGYDHEASEEEAARMADTETMLLSMVDCH